MVNEVNPDSRSKRSDLLLLLLKFFFKFQRNPLPSTHYSVYDEDQSFIMVYLYQLLFTLFVYIERGIT